jgi:ATP-dependent Lon protease
LTPEHIQTIVTNAARRLDIPWSPEVPGIISQYTIEGRQAINILADAYGLASSSSPGKAGRALRSRKPGPGSGPGGPLTQYGSPQGSFRGEVGKFFGLGVSGYLGSVLEIEAVAFRPGKGARASCGSMKRPGTMAKDSVFNAAP